MASASGSFPSNADQVSPPPANTPSMTRRSRTIVLCFDGTASDYSAENTNVVKFVSLLKKDNAQQIVYYQAGIGTYVSPGLTAPIVQWWAKLLDEAIAWYLPAHVMEGYQFLMQNYNVGDKVCLFGFSRGAYTARALAGMVHKVGLLSRDNTEQVPFAYNIYKSSGSSNNVLAQGFKETFCRDVTIEFLGAWDTVSNVGIIMGPSLPFTSSNTAIKTFRQALSLDEHRANFRPSLYTRAVPGSSVKTKFPCLSKLKKKFRTKRVRLSKMALHNEKSIEVESADSSDTTNVQEVWFVGCHSDIGGGSTPDSADCSLANIPLRWMVREVMKAQCGIVFDETAFSRLKIPSDLTSFFGGYTRGQETLPHDFFSPMDTPFSERESNDTQGSNSSSELDAKDALQPIHDQLVEAPVWWLLEVVPTNYTYQSSKTNQWVSEWSIHLGRGRWVPPNAMFHSSVKVRQDDASLHYTPRARYNKDGVTYVD